MRKKQYPDDFEPSEGKMIHHIVKYLIPKLRFENIVYFIEQAKKGVC
jgi:hypothetical protein